MKNRLFTGILFLIFGLLIAIGPQTIFPVCEAGNMPMKCFYTAKAEIGAGGLIAVLGVLSLIFSNKKIRAGISLATTLGGILTVLIPTALIGVCGGKHMTCSTLTLPALSVLGVVTAVSAAINAVYLIKSKDDSSNG